MTILFCGNTGEQITLTNILFIGGEGHVCNTNKNGYLAKVYQSPDEEWVEIDQERVEKLKVMSTIFTFSRMDCDICQVVRLSRLISLNVGKSYG